MADGFTYLFKGDLQSKIMKQFLSHELMSIICYLHVGQYVFRLTSDGQIDEGYPRAVSIEFEGLPGDLDAAITRSNGASYFFKV
jgi:hypothetical protein